MHYQPCHIYSDSLQRDGEREAFFRSIAELRPSQLDESSSIVSFRFDSPRARSPQLVGKVFGSIIYLSQRDGERNLGPHYHRHDTSSARRLLPISFLRGRRRAGAWKRLRNYVPCVSDFIISVGGTCAGRRAYEQRQGEEIRI